VLKLFLEKVSVIIAALYTRNLVKESLSNLTLSSKAVGAFAQFDRHRKPFSYGVTLAAELLGIFFRELKEITDKVLVLAHRVQDRRIICDLQEVIFSLLDRISMRPRIGILA
jgi:hypothetical protein